MSDDAVAILQRHSKQVGEALKHLLAQDYPAAPPKLLEAIGYSLMAGGKRLRPALVLESFAACGAQHNVGRWEGEKVGHHASHLHTFSPSHPLDSAMAAACAIELIHTFSLVHDDLPAMDDDDLRRGRPTCHKVFGEAMGILAGDAMVTMAFETLSRKADPEVAHKLVLELASAAGPAGMIGGQVLDMDGENQSLALEGLQRIHRMKTGALLTTSCRLGAIAAGAQSSQVDALTEFGQHMGLAFQIVDDILDVTSTPQQLGKATNKDANRGKNTYPSLLGLEGSRAEASRQLESAIQALGEFGDSANGLRTLARFVVERQV